MNLEHGKDPVSARWNQSTNSWDVGERKKYRWTTNDGKTPKSEWFYDISEALDWIKEHDKVAKTTKDLVATEAREIYANE